MFQQDQVIQMFIRKIRELIPEVKEAKLVTAIECNLSGVQASGIANAIDKMNIPVVHMRTFTKRQHEVGRVGVLTTNEVKRMWVTHFANHLRFGQIRFHEHLVSVSKYLDLTKDDAKAMKEKTLKQMRAYTRVAKKANDAFGTYKETFSGKHGGENDDLLTAVLMLTHNPTTFFSHPAYFHHLQAA